MEANARNLERIFDSTVSYQIPLFQRPYVWNEDKNWQPLWEDIQDLLDRNISKGRSRAHFLGAVVLEQINSHTGSIETRQVIDGQQRFTTLQLFMIAARDICRAHSNDKYFDRFNDLVANKESKVDDSHEVFKVWPTNSDRFAFEAVHRAGSVEALNNEMKAQPELFKESHQIIEGYKFFSGKLNDWLTNLIQDDNEHSVEGCFEALWQVIKNDLKLVVIDLDKDDESQVIFETLNARGTQLLPADLIKNYLFRRSQAAGEDTETLYKNYWQTFDSGYWREEIAQGRIKRPRIDLFMQHYLTLMMREEVKSAHLFESFKHYVQDLEESSVVDASSVAAHPKNIEGHLRTLTFYAKAFKTFSEPEPGSRLALFMRRLDAVDTATVYPLLLLACNKLLPDHKDQFDKFLVVLESFLFRRMVCGLTTKNYNRLFIDTIRYLDKVGEVSAIQLETFLKDGKGESTRFPDDAEFKQALISRPLYRHLAQYKLRAVLEALDMQCADRKSEAVILPDGLTIEHVLPQEWADYWPVPADVAADPVQKIEFSQARHSILHTLGNLTLITGSLNPSLSNAGWDRKRPELCKYSKLNLNRYFHQPLVEQEDVIADWNESTILKRGEKLADLALQVWA